ncbi:MAG TPA: hypothetical protein VF121_01185 [Thermoanaerobaculia bacterium]|nr:hypothetical protein [Thermoanaerobaculia bacterium]
MTTRESERPDVGEAAPIAESACVLFDPATGAVHHIHRSVTLTGGEVPSQQAVEERARGLAAQAGRSAGSLFDRCREQGV